MQAATTANTKLSSIRCLSHNYALKIHTNSIWIFSYDELLWTIQ